YIFGGSANLIQGNYIGTDITGTAAVGNTFQGIWLDSSAGNTIGGSGTGAGNLISGNNSDGILLTVGSDTNLVQGNNIGIDLVGTVALANHGAGVHVYSCGNTIGSAVAGRSNLIPRISASG